MWDNREDASAYLAGTYVRKGGKLVYISDIGGSDDELHAYYMEAVSGNTSTCPIEELDLSPIPLGFVNSNGRARYVMRKPQRRWKHGLDNTNAVSSQCGAPQLNRFNIGENIKGLEESVLNSYPSYEEALDEVTATGGSTAFTRSFAVRKGMHGNNLYYKAIKIGEAKLNPALNILPEYQYLQELLQEEIKHVGT